MESCRASESISLRRYVFSGSYSECDQNGIHLLAFNSDEGKLQEISSVGGVENPSFITVDWHKSCLFAVSETESGWVVSFAFDRTTGRISEISRQKTYGASPCHLSMDATGKWLRAVNYFSGTVCVFPVSQDGVIEPMTDSIQQYGHGPIIDRQEAAHPHTIADVPGTELLLVTDLGADRICLYEFDSGKLYLKSEFPATPGAGPRNAAFHPKSPLIYIVNELDSTVCVYSLDGQCLSLKQTLSTLPRNFKGVSTAADIHLHPSGRYLYASNRGHDTITTFRVLDTGLLEVVGYSPVFGQTPRNFAITRSGEYILVANQNSNSIVVMGIQTSGVPICSGEGYQLDNPTSIQISP